jgi:maleylacetoacetate isomerase
MYSLYSYYRSSCSWRVRLSLELKSLPYTLHQINLLQNDQYSPDYLLINPAGVVPALRLDDGVTVITQSVAILEYLEETSQNTKLLPDCPVKRALVRQLVQVIAADCQPLQNLHVLRRFTELTDIDDNTARQLWGRHYITRALDTYNSLITAGTHYSVNDSVSLADLCLIPQLYNARRFGIDVDKDFPHLARIEANFIEKHPEAYQRAHPDNSQ